MFCHVEHGCNCKWISRPEWIAFGIIICPEIHPAKNERNVPVAVGDRERLHHPIRRLLWRWSGIRHCELAQVGAGIVGKLEPKISLVAWKGFKLKTTHAIAII